MNTSENQEASKKLRSIALKLDKGINSGEIETDFTTSAQEFVNQFYIEIDTRRNHPDWMYLVYESQALLYWIEGDEKNARSVILKAVEARGSLDLMTENGKRLLGDNTELSIDAHGRVGVGSPIVSRVAFSFGILAILLSLSGSALGPTLGLIAVVMGGTSLKTSNRRIAFTGIVLGLVSIVLFGIIRAYWLSQAI